MTSSNGFFAFLALCVGNSTVTGEFPSKGQWHGAVMFSLICALNKRLSKQSWGWLFETPSCSLWRHCNGVFLMQKEIWLLYSYLLYSWFNENRRNSTADTLELRHLCIKPSMYLFAWWCCYIVYHDYFIKRKHFPQYWPLCGVFTGHRNIPLTNTSDAELWCFLWSAPEQTVE